MINKENYLSEIWLAGGCFWGVEAFLSGIPGVVHTETGYANGKTENPTYEDVCRKDTGHAETVYVRYDPDQIPLKKLLEYFFKIIDPTSLNRQGNDVGIQYRTGIYYKEASDKEIIEECIRQLQNNLNRKIVTEVLPVQNFYKAEEYHQKYLEKNPNGYCHINLDLLRDITR